MKCPRRVLPGGPDEWRGDGTCSYCGSLSPEKFFQMLEAGEELGPTDKDYKVYIGDWKKFYFYHLSESDMEKFISMYNNREIRFGFPGYFYTLPFFMKLEEAE